MLIVAGVAAFLYFIVPIAEWLIVDRTIAVYNEVNERFAMDNDEECFYEGVIVDTVITPSAKNKGKVDTILHRQTIRIIPPEKSGDERPSREDVGMFGDSAGMLNAIFSFMAFIAVLVTLWFQRNKDDNDRRNGARVQFEQEFFAMVGMLEEIVAHLKFTDYENVENAKPVGCANNDLLKGYGINPKKEDDGEVDKYKPNVVEGREVFEYLYKDRENYNLLKYLNSEDPNSSYSSEEAQRMCFDGTLDHYFRYLYRILKHIDESELLEQLDDSETEREKYAHLLRAQLSNYELLMWFYNGLLGDEHPRTVKRLIERYAMFNNLRAWELGKKDSEYYQNILDGEMFEDPENYDEKTKYSVTAFWSKKKLSEFNKKLVKEQKASGLCEKLKESWRNRWEVRKKNETKEQEKEDANPKTVIEESSPSKPKSIEKQPKQTSKKGTNNPKKGKNNGRKKKDNMRDKQKERLRKNTGKRLTS